MRRSASTAPFCGPDVTALLLIGSIRLLAALPAGASASRQRVTISRNIMKSLNSMPPTTCGHRAFRPPPSDGLVAADGRYIGLRNPSLPDMEHHTLPANGQEQRNRNDHAGHGAAPLTVETVCPKLALGWCCHPLYVWRLPPMLFQPEARGILDPGFITNLLRPTAHREGSGHSCNHGGLERLRLHAACYDAHTPLNKEASGQDRREFEKGNCFLHRDTRLSGQRKGQRRKPAADAVRFVSHRVGSLPSPAPLRSVL